MNAEKIKCEKCGKLCQGEQGLRMHRLRAHSDRNWGGSGDIIPPAPLPEKTEKAKPKPRRKLKRLDSPSVEEVAQSIRIIQAAPETRRASCHPGGREPPLLISWATDPISPRSADDSSSALA